MRNRYIGRIKCIGGYMHGEYVDDQGDVIRAVKAPSFPSINLKKNRTNQEIPDGRIEKYHFQIWVTPRGHEIEIYKLHGLSDDAIKNYFETGEKPK